MAETNVSALPTDASPGPVPLGEAAASTPLLDFTKPFVGPLEINNDSVLAKKGGGLEIYEEVLRDDQVFSCFQQRRQATISKEWQVDAGGTDKASVMAADFIRETLLSPQVQFDDKAGKMLYSAFYGYGHAELMYARDGRNVVIDAIKVRKARRFRFDTDGGLRLLTRADMFTGELMPEKKFWTWVYGCDNDDDRYGTGLAHWCYWPVFFKRNDIRLWMIFLDKFGQPTPRGTFPPTATETEKRRLLQAAQALATSSAVIHPAGMTLDLIQSTRSGAGEYGTAYEKFDAAIAKVLLSQTATTQGTPGKLGNDDDQMKVRDEIAKSDSDLQCAGFNNGPVRWLTEWNFPGAIPPRVFRNFAEPDDLQKAAQTDTQIYGLGFEPSEEYIQDRYGPHWTKRAAPPPSLFIGQGVPGRAANDPIAPGQQAAAFAEAVARQTDAIDTLVAQMQKDGNEAMAAPVAELRLAFAQATSFADLKGRLEQLQKKGLKMDALGNMLSATTFQVLGGAILGDMMTAAPKTIGEVIGK